MDEGGLSSTPTGTITDLFVILFQNRQLKGRACKCTCAQYRTATCYGQVFIIGQTRGSFCYFLKNTNSDKTRVNISQSWSLQVEECDSFTVIVVCVRVCVTVSVMLMLGLCLQATSSRSVAVSPFTLGFL